METIGRARVHEVTSRSPILGRSKSWQVPGFRVEAFRVSKFN